MKGYVEVVEPTFVKGWAYDPRGVAEIRVLDGGRLLTATPTDVPRPDVATAMKAEGALNRFGFRIPLPPDTDPARLEIVAKGPDGRDVKLPALPRKRARPRAAGGAYQDFDGTGASKSHDKLKALRLHDVRKLPGAATPLEGKSVLDLGCNEGFFCAEALAQGAARVVGIDMRPHFIDKARVRTPKAEFRVGSWWDLPAERFDVILFLSAIHYEEEQQRLLHKLLVDNLKPGGTLVLECGVLMNRPDAAWVSVRRQDGVRRYPTVPLLENHLLQGYSVRRIGPSVAQGGDPIPRFVFHCTPKAPTALLIAGGPLRGKTTFASHLGRAGVPAFSIDRALNRLLRDPYYRWRPIARKLAERFPAEEITNFSQVGVFIVEKRLEQEVCEAIVDDLPVEADTFSVEGDLLRHPSIQDRFKQLLERRGIRCWLAGPF